MVAEKCVAGPDEPPQAANASAAVTIAILLMTTPFVAETQLDASICERVQVPARTRRDAAGSSGNGSRIGTTAIAIPQTA